MVHQVFQLLILSLLIFFFLGLYPGSEQKDGSTEERLTHGHEGTKETFS